MNLKMTRVIKETPQMELMKESGVAQCRISHAEKGLIRLNTDEKQQRKERLLKEAKKTVKIGEWEVQNIDEIAQGLWNTRETFQNALDSLKEILAKIYNQEEGKNGTA